MKIFFISGKTLSVLLLLLLCISLWIFRIQFTGELTGFFLAWNLFLAFVPLFIILIARRIYNYSSAFNRWAVYSLLLLWLLFFPNSPYIITDLIHLNHLPKELLWFDSLGIFLTAATGLVVGLYSVDIFRNLTSQMFGMIISSVLTISSLILSAFGVYLGRYVRLNSWDLFTQPLELVKIVISQFNNPLALNMTMVFGLVLVVVYFSFTQFMGNYANQQDDK